MEIQNIVTHQEEENIIKFSEQHLIDCNPYGYGCGGAEADKIVRDWMIPQEKRLVLNLNYPYVQEQQACNSTVETLKWRPTKQVDYEFDPIFFSPKIMISALADEGPLVTVIRADSAIF